MQGHAGPIQCITTVDNVVWSASDDGFVRCWADEGQPKQLRSLHVSDHAVYAMAHIPAADQVWLATADGSVVVLHHVSTGSSDDSMSVQVFEKDGDKYVGDVLEADTSHVRRASAAFIDVMQRVRTDAPGDDTVFTKHGHGELHYANGSIYVGEFRVRLGDGGRA